MNPENCVWFPFCFCKNVVLDKLPQKIQCNIFVLIFVFEKGQQCAQITYFVPTGSFGCSRLWHTLANLRPLRVPGTSYKAIKHSYDGHIVSPHAFHKGQIVMLLILPLLVNQRRRCPQKSHFRPKWPKTAFAVPCLEIFGHFRTFLTRNLVFPCAEMGSQ